MSDVARGGRTVIFVSHNLPAIANLCGLGIVLNAGRLVRIAQASEAIRLYSSSTAVMLNTSLSTRTDRRGIGNLRFTAVSIHDAYGKETDSVETGETVQIWLHYASSAMIGTQNSRLSVTVHDIYGQIRFLCSSELVRDQPLTLPSSGIAKCIIPRLPLSEGEYTLEIFMEVGHEVQDWVEDAHKLAVVDGDFYGTGRLYPIGWKGKGVLIDYSWYVE
jgi:lipopolysaccharide transport system ATP-binding protein